MADPAHRQYDADLAVYRAIVGRPATSASAPARAAAVAPVALPARASSAWRSVRGFCRRQWDDARRLAWRRASEAFRRLSRLA